jgi:hypothetical protein
MQLESTTAEDIKRGFGNLTAGDMERDIIKKDLYNDDAPGASGEGFL